VSQAIERIVGVFDGNSQRQIVMQLSNSLQGIIAQELLPAADRTRRVLAYELLIANGAVPVPIYLRESRDFAFDPNELEASITPQTKLLILNTPHNPTGGILARADLEAIAEILRRHPQIWVFADEIYSRLTFDGAFFSIAQVPGMYERTIISDGASKTWAMTGWRIGFIANRTLAPVFTRWITNTDSCASQISQWAAVEAINGPQDAAAAMRASFLERRDLIVGLLNEVPGFTCKTPGGAFYAWPNVTEACKQTGCADSEELRKRLLYDAGVAVLADCDRAPLCAAADGAADVQVRGGGRAAGDHERAQRGERGVDLVAGALEPLGVVGADAQAPARVRALTCLLLRRRHGQVGADVEQVVLHAGKPLRELLGHPGLKQRNSDRGVELVDGAVGLDARVHLGDTAHVAEVRLATVAELRVDAGEVDGHACVDDRRAASFCADEHTSRRRDGIRSRPSCALAFRRRRLRASTGLRSCPRSWASSRARASTCSCKAGRVRTRSCRTRRSRRRALS